MLKINVYDITGERAILDSDGDLIYNKIVSALSNNNDVELSFENVTTILSIFTTSAIGQLYKKFTSDNINHLTLGVIFHIAAFHFPLARIGIFICHILLKPDILIAAVK